jgi:hypothetical protein
MPTIVVKNTGMNTRRSAGRLFGEMGKLHNGVLPRDEDSGF